MSQATPQPALEKPRYELKYVLRADAVTRFIESIRDELSEDPHAVGGGYHVNSLYYDTFGFDAYTEKIEGEDPRYKVRVRGYGRRPGQEGPQKRFVEIKHRNDVMIHKDRVTLMSDVLWPPPNGDTLAKLVLDHTAPHELHKAAEVARHILARPLVPACRVRYYRRAFGSPINPTLRITVDTSLRASGPSVGDEPGAGLLFLPPALCVLELKYHYAIPLWLRDAARHLALDSRRYSKYCSAVERLYPGVGTRAVRLADLH